MIVNEIRSKELNFHIPFVGHRCEKSTNVDKLPFVRQVTGEC